MSELKLFGDWIGEQSLELIYGGTATGAMQLLAESCLQKGGKVTGYIPQALADMPRLKHPQHHVKLVDSLATRKTKMIEDADIIVAAPGGLGTLDEFTDVLTLKALGQANARLFLHNPLDYWGPLLELFAELKHRGAMSDDYQSHFVLTERVQDLIERIKNG